MTDALRAHKPGDVVAVTVQRDGKPLTVSVTLGARS
jgi:S1-C subfamily serine protease